MMFNGLPVPITCFPRWGYGHGRLRSRRAPGVPIAVRSGGHGISGRSTNDGGIVIDLSALNSVDVVDRERRLVRVGPGARWGEVAQALAPHRLAISSGDYGDVGVGGLATIGGQGYVFRTNFPIPPAD
ncbi:UNVERIFIED_ORG: FAD binding domain-containing protein [Actinomadura viridilutea]